MNIIIESGATKGDWRIVSPSGEESARFLSSGINVSTMTFDAVRSIILETSAQIVSLGYRIENIFFYTAGIPTPSIKEELTAVFNNIFPSAKVEIEDDLMAAARAVCGHNCGITAILGTGSNSCQWDGEKIVKRIRTGGFILGDEGSASALGKAFISDFIKDLIKAVAEKFTTDGPVDLNLVLPESLKNDLEPFASKELAKILGAGVEASFSKKIAGGFQIGPKDGGYFVSFTEETFSQLISEYLRPATKKLLFG